MRYELYDILSDLDTMLLYSTEDLLDLWDFIYPLLENISRKQFYGLIIHHNMDDINKHILDRQNLYVKVIN